MINLLKNFKFKDWLLFFILLSFTVFQTYCDVTLPMYTANIINEMKSPTASFSSMMSIGAVMLIFTAGSVFASIIKSIIATFLSSGFAMRVRLKIFSKVSTFSHEELTKFSTPSLITRSTNDVQQVTSTFTLLMYLAFSAPLMAIWAILKIRSSSYELTIATATGVVIMLIGISGIMMMVTPRFKIIQKLTDKLNGVTRENLTGLRVIKAHNAEDFHHERFEEANEDLTRNNLFTNRIMGLMSPLMMLINYGLTIAIYWIGAFLINRNNDPAFFATLFSFSQLAMQVISAFMMLLMLLLSFPRARVSSARINEVLKTEANIKDPLQPEAFKSTGEIEFKDVSFSYPGSNTNSLSNISFKVEKGETVAIIGATGSGKTTLSHLMLRFFDATQGEVLINGVNIKNVLLENLYNTIGYVPQSSVLFTGTVTDNIAYGNPSLEQGKVENAAKVACADEFITQMDGGYQAQISQGGKNISGGQKQRLSIARAVATDPEIYLFDDSFSALDYKTDTMVRKNLKEHASHASMIIVAQRIGTIIDADKIIVLDHGTMVSCGQHKQLLKECEIYKSIALSQLSKEELGL